MDFKPLIQWLQRQITTGFFWTKILNSKDISDPIVQAIEGKEYETVNPDSISEPIVEAVSETTQAIKDLEFPRNIRVLNLDEVKLDLGEVVSLLEALISKKDKEIVVKQGDVNVDLKPLQKELEKIRKAIPETEKQEVIDYTLMLDQIMKLLERPGYQVELLQILQRLENIKFPDFKFNKDGELIVEQGKQRIFFDHKNQNKDGVYINPATEETLSSVETKLQTLIDAQGDIVIDAEQINLNTDTLEANQDPLVKYKWADVDDDASPNYYGATDKDGNWYILKEVVSPGANTYRYAVGSSGYAAAWTARASQDYGYFNDKF